MAKLTMQLGPAVAEITIPDARALEIVEDIRDEYNGPTDGTKRAQLLWVLRQVGRYMVEVSAGRRARLAAEDARTASLAERETEKWT